MLEKTHIGSWSQQTQFQGHETKFALLGKKHMGSRSQLWCKQRETKERHRIQIIASKKKKKKNHFFSANIQIAITKCKQSDASKRVMA